MSMRPQYVGTRHMQPRLFSGGFAAHLFSGWNVTFMVVGAVALWFVDSRSEAWVVGLSLAVANVLGYAQGLWSRR